MYSMEDYLQKFEREEFGTNDFGEILNVIRERAQEDAERRLTGMEEEQADWDADEEVGE